MPLTKTELNNAFRILSRGRDEPLRRWLEEDRRQARKHYLATLRALSQLQAEIENRINAEGRAAIRMGATYAAAGRAAGFTRQRAHQRFRPDPEDALAIAQDDNEEVADGS